MTQKAEKNGATVGEAVDLRPVFKSLGTRNDSIQRTIERLEKETGKRYGYSAVNAVINGHRFTKRIAEAFLAIAEEMKADLAEIKARAEKLVPTKQVAP